MKQSLKNNMSSSVGFYNHLVNKFKICDFLFIPIRRLGKREKIFFRTFMPGAKTAITVYYPVKKLIDWNWNCPDRKIESERCNIDDWSQKICIYLRDLLLKSGHNTRIVPYPQNSGLQFRYVAAAPGIGEIGKNTFYLHPSWGSRVHLRVLASQMETEPLCSIQLKTNKVCLDCGKCISKCPAHAFEKGFNGLRCREFRKLRGEYEPFGKKGSLRYCRICMTVCKAGKDNLLRG